MENKESNFHISPEIQEEASSLIRNAFDQMRNHSRKMAEDLEQFEHQRDEIRQRMKHGARRTSGRIIRLPLP